jgi:hypothetical protein
VLPQAGRQNVLPKVAGTEQKTAHTGSRRYVSYRQYTEEQEKKNLYPTISTSHLNAEGTEF